MRDSSATIGNRKYDLIMLMKKKVHVWSAKSTLCFIGEEFDKICPRPSTIVTLTRSMLNTIVNIITCIIMYFIFHFQQITHMHAILAGTYWVWVYLRPFCHLLWVSIHWVTYTTMADPHIQPRTMQYLNWYVLIYSAKFILNHFHKHFDIYLQQSYILHCANLHLQVNLCCCQILAITIAIVSQ